MPSVPKPPKRAPKARKRIPRGAAPKRKSRPRPIRKGETAAIRRKAAALWGKIVRGRVESCQAFAVGWSLTLGPSGLGLHPPVQCGRPVTDAAHVLGKGAFPNIRFNLANGIGLCHADHEELGEAQLCGPSPMRELYQAIYGAAAWDALVTAAALPGPRPVDALAELEKVAQRGSQGAERAS